MAQLPPWIPTLSTSTNSHKIELTGLTTGQTYHFRVQGMDKNDQSMFSDDYMFATFSQPKLDDYNIVEITDSGCKIQWKTNVPTDSNVEYTDQASQQSATQGASDHVTDHGITLTGLEAGTKYEAKIKGTDVNKNTFFSDPFTLETNVDNQPPQISQVKAESYLVPGKEDLVQSIIFWGSDESSTSRVVYEEGIHKTEGNFSKESAEDTNLTTKHIVVLVNLKPATVYHFKTVGADKSGNRGESKEFTLLTPRSKQSIVQIIISNFEQMFGWARKLGG